jgi:hypothetical protein
MRGLEGQPLFLIREISVIRGKKIFALGASNLAQQGRAKEV